MFLISDISTVFLKISKSIFSSHTKGKAVIKQLMAVKIT